MATPCLSRRRFLATSTAAAAWAALRPGLAGAATPAAPTAAFSCVLFGDLHFDRLAHHDLRWVKAAHPGDVSQIENYSRLTAEIMPRLFAAARAAVAPLAAEGAGAAPAALVLQVGDLVEGLCGSEELALRQNREVLEALRAARWELPFLFAKGNHDITGPGAPAAFDRVFLPFLTAERRRLQPAAAPVTSANYTVERGNAQFAFFDAYAPDSLDWLETVAARRTAEHFFVVLHPPVVPYGSRATWYLYSSPREQARRQRVLDLLGAQRAFVLGGHIHRFAVLTRRTPRGAFVQLAVSSVVSKHDPAPREQCSVYDEAQVGLEPRFSPPTAAERRAVYRAEAPLVGDFAYADLPGFALLRIAGPRVTASLHAGTTGRAWRTLDLSALQAGARASA